MYGGHLVEILQVEDSQGLVKWVLGNLHKMGLGLEVLQEQVQLGVVQRLVVQVGLTRARASTTGNKGTVSGKSRKADSVNGDAEDGKSKKGQYEGPDPEMAAMLERDVLETSTGVRWDDVAGLTEAKRLLEEAVVLPLWMPEY